MVSCLALLNLALWGFPDNTNRFSAVYWTPNGKLYTAMSTYHFEREHQSVAIGSCLAIPYTRHMRSLSPLMPTFAADFTGQVVGVIDGDSIRVMHNGRAEEIRLNGIDCPEKGQAYGKRTKQTASELVFGKDVTLQTHGKDKYGRTIDEVFLPDGTNVTHFWQKAGWGVSHDQRVERLTRSHDPSRLELLTLPDLGS